MATEEKVIFDVDIENLQSLNEFKKALSDLRKEKNGLSTESERFNELTQQEAQILAKQKDAMNQVKTVVTAAEGSFDALNQQLAGLKAQWKATSDEVERAKLTEQINGVKAQINGMNESIGNFQHNVGNYANAMREVFGGATGSVVGGVQKVNTALKTLYANPIIALIGGLAAVIMGIVKAIKSSEDAMHRVNLLLAPMRMLSDAVLNVLQGLAHKLLSVFEAVGGWIGKILERLGKTFPKIAEFNEKLKESVVLQKEANSIEKESRDLQVENARKQLEISELRAKANNKEVYTAEQRLEFVRRANALELEMSKKNKEMAERRLRVMEEEAARAENNAETNEQLKDQQIAVYEAQKAYHEKSRELLGQENAILAEIRANAAAVAKEAEKVKKEWMDAQLKAGRDAIDEFAKQDEEELQNFIETELKKQKEKDEQLKKDKEREEKRKNIVMASVAAVGNTLSALADIYESNGEQDAEAQKKAKNLRIAGATIDMLQGAVMAYSGAQSLGPIAGPIIGAINAAAVIAAGSANIAKIKSTDVSGNSSNTSATPNVGAIVSAPAVIQQVPVTRSLTGASEEERLNQIAQNTASTQRVVLVYSDVEAAAQHVEVQQTETSF